MGKEKVTKKNTVNSPVVYIGPNIPAKGLKSYRIYKNGIPEEFRGIFSSLFVSPEELSMARIATTAKGTAINAAYRKIANQDWSEK